jgi:hypothetical protein
LEIDVAQIALMQHSAAQISATQVGVMQDCFAQIGVAQVGVRQDAVMQHSTAQISAAEVVLMTRRVMLDLAAVDGVGLSRTTKQRDGHNRQTEDLHGSVHAGNIASLFQYQQLVRLRV